MALITTEQAIDHLRISTDAAYERDLELKMEVATAQVIKYLKRPDHGWTVETVDDPEFTIVQGAILEVLANIFFDRGDRDEPSDGPITPRIKNALSMLRAPTLS